jgi:hypothetical protein
MRLRAPPKRRRPYLHRRARGNRCYRPTMRSGTWIAFIVLFSIGCKGGSSGPDAFSFGERCEPGGTFDINGRAAVLGMLNVHVNAGGVIETDTTAELLIIMDIVQDGTAVTVTAQACAIEIPDVPLAGQDEPITFEVPAATVESVAGVTGTGELSSPDETCASIETSELVIIIGARLADGEEDTAPLPAADMDGNFTNYCAPGLDTECDLAIGTGCACDQEGDAKPGATLLASNVPGVELDEIYITLRTKFTLSGEVHSSDLVLGIIEATLEQGILGCHKADGETCSPNEVNIVNTLNPEVTQQEGNPSLFRAVRVGDATTCAEVIEMRDDLFPR